LGINVPHLPQPAAGPTPADLAALAQVAGVADAEQEYIDQPDGSVIVRDVMAADAELLPFDANLAEAMDPAERQALGAELCELIERDIESREKRDKQYQEALQRAGLAGDDNAVGGAQFPGASRVAHPILAEACVDYEARIIKELCPPNGPVKSKIVGTPTPEKQAKADRKARYMNWQLTEQCREYIGELEQLQTQVPLGGSQYLKIWWDAQKNRPAFEFRPIDHMALQASAGQWQTARRKTDCLRLTEAEWKARIASGMYLDNGSSPPLAPDETLAAQANDKIEGVDRDAYNEDGVRIVYECYVEMDIGNGDGIAPYVIHIDHYSEQVVAAYRNWEESDPHKEALAWIVEWQFIPWRGPLGISLWHLIGGLAIAGTGALRALLDSAHANNSQTAAILKGAKVSGQSRNPAPGEQAIIEAPAGTTDPDIRKMMMPLTYAQPSGVLFELLGWLTDAAKGVVTTAEEKIADASNSMPVGTAQALIEQGSRVFSAIHARQHRSQAEVLAILHRLNAKHLTADVVVAELGDLVVTPQDFQGPMDVVPVSDPAIFSETQRLTQAQAVLSMATADSANPNPAVSAMWDQRAVRKTVLEAMKVPNVDELLPQPPKPQPMDPAAAVVAMLSGQPVGADPSQDHVAHIEVVAQALANPMLGGSVLGASKFVPAALAYIQQHVAMLYGQMMQQATQAAGMQAQAAGVPMAPEAVQAMASPSVMQALQQQLQALPGVIQQALGVMKQAQDTQQALIPKPPPDPQTQADMAEVERRAARDQQDAQTKAMETQAKVAMNDADNSTALTIEQMREQHSVIRDAMKPQQIPGGMREVNPNPGA
jgi:hypothetical protein